VTSRRISSSALIGSLTIHAIIGIPLLFPFALRQQAAPMVIEFVSAPDENDGARRNSHLKKLKASPPPKESRIQAAPSADTIPQPAMTDLTGESDIESELQDRAPTTDKERYLAEIRRKIAIRQNYPRLSRVLNEQGSVKLLLTIQRNGSLTKVELVRGTPFERLNTAAMTAATEAGPFKEFPAEVKYASWRITLPIHFSLN
jgi:TonB family protein